MKILFYPHYYNPYQVILKEKIESHKNWNVEFLNINHKSFLYLIIPLIRYKRDGFVIFHLHWPDFTFFTFGTANYLISFLNTVLSIILIKAFGFKLIWTVHNIVPHERQTSNDVSITRFICRQSDAIIVHSRSVISELMESKVKKSKINLIEIGNYNNIYKNEISRQDARERLNIKKTDFVFLYFGLIRPYKNLDELIDAFNEATILKTGLRLIIVGGSNDDLYVNKLKKKINDKNTFFISKYIEDDEVQKYFNSADIAVFPFKEVTTTSSTLVAFSFKKAIIAPRLGSINDYPEDTGIYYSSTRKNGILGSLLTALSRRAEMSQMGDRAYRFSNSNNWELTADKTIDLYESVSREGQ